MEMRTLGRTGVKVSVIGFGGIPVGNLPHSEGEQVIQHVVTRDITIFDTAPNYGASEGTMGWALENVREKRIIATKAEEKTRADIARTGIEVAVKPLLENRPDAVAVGSAVVVNDRQNFKLCLSEAST